MTALFSMIGMCIMICMSIISIIVDMFIIIIIIITIVIIIVRLRNNKLGPAWVLGPEDRSGIESERPNYVKFGSIMIHINML